MTRTGYSPIYREPASSGGSGLEHLVMVGNVNATAPSFAIAASGLADIPVPDTIVDTDGYVSGVDPAYPLVIPAGLDGLYDFTAGITFASTTVDPTSGYVWLTLTASAPGGTPVWGDIADGRYPFGVWTSSNELTISGKAALYVGAKIELFVWNRTNQSITVNGTHIQYISAALFRQFTPTYT